MEVYVYGLVTGDRCDLFCAKNCTNWESNAVKYLMSKLEKKSSFAQNT